MRRTSYDIPSILAFGLILLTFSAYALAGEVPEMIELIPDNASFGTVKKRLYDTVHKDQEVTLYCNCLFNPDDLVIDQTLCGMAELTSTRAKKTEAEHLVTAYAIGNALGCWVDGGRTGCLKNDPVFKKAHNDLHNLVPSVGLVNAARSNLQFGLVDGEERTFGECDFEVDRDKGVVEPRPEVRGDIARAHFYMEYQYGVVLTESQRRLMLWWHQKDPVDKWEKERNFRIAEIQGNHNPFVLGSPPPEDPP